MNRAFYMLGYGVRSAVHGVASATGGAGSAVVDAAASTKQGWLDKATMLKAQAAAIRAGTPAPSAQAPTREDIRAAGGLA